MATSDSIAACFCVLDIFLEDNVEELYCIDKMNDYIIHLLMMPRKHIPRIQDFVEETVTMHSTDDFRTHFRLNRTTVEIILNIIAPRLTAVHDGGKKEITPKKQLLLFIWYLANQESMRETGNLFGVSLLTVHKIVIKVTSALKEGFLNVIQWLDPAAQNITAQLFQLASGFPGIIDVLDGTHIRLSSPIGGDSDYINRKGYPSIQLQIVVDHNLKIVSAHTGWPGCADDA
ncbi:putative nuclease HARBI1 [Saccostrea cucullata]|uniref:putative nuclease HARBI1 n=1 Tax=Saccostrea cuccullata TaxID=36930 RepID=UPI002ED6B754